MKCIHCLENAILGKKKMNKVSKVLWDDAMILYCQLLIVCGNSKFYCINHENINVKCRQIFKFYEY